MSCCISLQHSDFDVVYPGTTLDEGLRLGKTTISTARVWEVRTMTEFCESLAPGQRSMLNFGA